MSGDAHGGGHGSGGGIGTKILGYVILAAAVVFLLDYMGKTTHHWIWGADTSTSESSFVGVTGNRNTPRTFGPTPAQRAVMQREFDEHSRTCEEQAAKRRDLGFDSSCEISGAAGKPTTWHAEGGFQESGKLD